MRICTKCGEEKPETSVFFCKDRRHHLGLTRVCRECLKSYNRERYQEVKDDPKFKELRKERWNRNRDRYNKSHHRWRKDNKEKVALSVRKLWQKRKKEVIAEMGGKCRCCGETIFEFLTVDHIDGGGYRHAKKRTVLGVYLDIIREGYPKDKYQVLCMNCNWAMKRTRICPHRKDRS